MLDRNVPRLLRRLLSEAGDEHGPMTISELSRRLRKPRSTIHRHLRGEMITLDSIQHYALVFSRGDKSRKDDLIREFKEAAGLPMPSPDGISDEIRAMNVELINLDEEGRDAIWKIIGILRKTNAPPVQTYASSYTSL